VFFGLFFGDVGF